MAVTWAMQMEDAQGARSEAKIGFAMLPGSSQSYRFATKAWEQRGDEESPHVPLLAASGRMAGVSASSSDPRRASGFVVWLAGREASLQISPVSASTTLFRNSHVTASTRWTGSLAPESSRQYAEVLAQTLSLPRAFPGLTIPGRIDYLSALDDAVQQAAGGQLSAKEALKQAAARWQEITGKLGSQQQRGASSRSLGQGEF
jgi:ABC-type glycerol-3-phosphate transport system substrate-binding protein